jgi:holliday junction DNA helicase RuvA
MIGKLKGILDSIESDRIILDVSGVGYIVNCSNKSISKLPFIGEAASFLIYMQVKEDDISLYGFSDLAEKEWFENLISVQGIGPRLALTILSALEPSELIQAIIEKSKETFKHISGVGPKLAERMFTELNKKSGQSSHLTSGTSISSQDEDNISDALIALTNLGYNRNEAYNACRKIYKNNPDITINELIKSSLKELSQ